MYCVFHPTNAAAARCSGCGRSLCAACDHRIKALPFCEDCIVRGVDALRRPVAPVIVQSPIYPPADSNGPSSVKATILAFVPGLGAVYNRQNLKAVLHFVGTVGLIELGDVTNIGMFVFGGLVFFLYTVIDANRSAKAIAAGVDAREDERRLQWLFARYKPVWGVALLVVALIAALSSLSVLPFGLSIVQIWAVMLFLAGTYLVVSYFRSLKSTEESRSYAGGPPPRSVVSSMLPGEVPGMTTNYSDTRSTSTFVDR
ncbi:MAG: hypothetical protein IPF53_10885 [Blastocatellia bacterium]|nr:hypothetical protein [Blastocatellia bacterium]